MYNSEKSDLHPPHNWEERMRLGEWLPWPERVAGIQCILSTDQDAKIFHKLWNRYRTRSQKQAKVFLVTLSEHYNDVNVIWTYNRALNLSWVHFCKVAVIVLYNRCNQIVISPICFILSVSCGSYCISHSSQAIFVFPFLFQLSKDYSTVYITSMFNDTS